MKNKILNIKDFELEKINREAQKAVRGGDNEPEPPIVPPTNNPVKGGGGNGNG